MLSYGDAKTVLFRLDPVELEKAINAVGASKRN